MKQFIWKLSGVDVDIMERSSNADKAYAMVLGLLVLSSGFFILLIAYDAFSYLMQGFFAFLFSLLVTSIMTLLNVSILQKSWISQEKNFIKDIVSLAGRMIVALFLAFALGGFLLLSVFESNIIDVMQEKHRQANEALYQEYEKKRVDKEQEVQILKNRVDQLTKKLMNLESLKLDSPTAYINMLSLLNKRKNDLKNEQQVLQRSLHASIERENALQEQLERLHETLRCEMNGLGRVHFHGETILCSTIPNPPGHMGPRSIEIQGQIEEKRRALNNIESRIRQKKRDLQKKQNELNSIYKQEQELSKKLNEAQVLPEQLKKTQLRINSLKKEIQNKEKEFQIWRNNFSLNITKDPRYKPMKDDLVTRYEALLVLFSDEQKGPSMMWMAAGILALVMLFEIVPIFVKLFYRRPTVYALLLKHLIGISELRWQTHSIKSIKDDIR